METHDGYVNRGFLFSPYLPIYGFGGIILIALLTSIRNKKIYFGCRQWIFVELIFGVVSIIVALFSRKIYVGES